MFPCANPIGGVAPLAGDISLRRQQTVDFAPASADRGTPSPTSLWLVDLPPLAVCSFNSLYSALLAPSMQGRRLLVSPASSLSSSVPVCQRAIFPSLPRAAYLPSALRSGNLCCALLGIEPNALTGWRVTHRAEK